MSERLDHILKQALTPDQKPDLLLNQKILNQIKEKDQMKIRKRKMGSRYCFFSCAYFSGRNGSRICGI